MNTPYYIYRSAKNAVAAVAVCAFFLLGGEKMGAQNVIFNNEAADTTRITSILIDEAKQRVPGDVVRIAELFLDTPYKNGTLEGEGEETLRVNLNEMDCTTFVETVLALAYTSGEHRQSWHDFAFNLRRIRYREGETSGYASRLHYVSDWILDNVARGNFMEVTTMAPEARYAVKSLDYMSANRNAYPALADDNNFAGIKNVESGFSNHRFPYLKASWVKSKRLAELTRNGDVVVFTTSTKGLDATHMGIVKMVDGVPRLIHASSKTGKVVLDPLTIEEYVKRYRPEGLRIIRLRKD